ncbi:hypothetical protein F0P96_17610 [Hymenobacter busanensis]|uniref:Uncharacterized protein n=1 Tax=Hymenobacter busanensis TaxID=2607656 RepID=A0A7L5A149_9BACT|nr:hypothetical protein [Hymenobacter busanensis]KAA9327058.1 hypothetical protein F0P96_17610 [Hymenobacter busanensis]QHJ09509.1 hypothetical protein GUY19_20425 [Hymenobacter busanensis]
MKTTLHLASPVSTSAASSVSRATVRPEWLRILHACNPPLVWVGWLHVALLVLALLLWPFDERTVTGLNVWIKPAKFSASGVLYLWTLAWLLADLPAAAQRQVRWLSWGVAVSMAVEILSVVVQAARGTTSHFNVGSALDGMIFSLMGVFIMINTLMLMWALGLLLRYRPFGSAAWVWGMRLGLGLFLVGSAVGGSMVSHLGHTIGAADGGPGLPLLGWSTRHGDLRAAHFLGLHALQALPLVGWLLTRYAPQLRPAAQTLGVVVFAGLYAGAIGWLYWHALSGLPLLRA